MSKEEIQENRLCNFRQIIKNVDSTNEAERIMGKKNSYITQIACLPLINRLLLS